MNPLSVSALNDTYESGKMYLRVCYLLNICIIIKIELIKSAIASEKSKYFIQFDRNSLEESCHR